MTGSPRDLDHIQPRSVMEWQDWLSGHHSLSEGVWLILFKKSSGQVNLTYDQALDEAIAFGWIDSRSRPVDEDRYAVRFTPRRNSGNWSVRNLRKVRELLSQGRMREPGLKALPPDLEQRLVLLNETDRRGLKIPPLLRESLAQDVEVWRRFLDLPPQRREECVQSVMSAGPGPPRSARVKEVMARLREVGE